MSKLVRDLGPLAIVTVVFGLVTAYLLSAGSNLGSWLFAAFLAGHGWIHMMYVIPQPQPQPATAGSAAWPFSLNQSWLGRSDAMKLLGFLLVAVTVIGYELAGLATIHLLVPADLWSVLALVATVASATLMLLFFSPALVIGLGIDVVILAVVLFSGWRPV